MNTNELVFTNEERELCEKLKVGLKERVANPNVQGDIKTLMHCCISQQIALLRIMNILQRPVLVSEANKQGETNPTNTVPSE